jgi:hypothetical protein
LINFCPLKIPLIEGDERGRNLPLPPHRGGMEGNQKQGKFII